MEGALDDVAKQLDKQALEEKEKDDDDEGKCNLSFLLTFPVSACFLDSHFNKPLQMPFGFGCFLLVFLLGRVEMQLYILFTFLATV